MSKMSKIDQVHLRAAMLCMSKMGKCMQLLPNGKPRIITSPCHCVRLSALRVALMDLGAHTTEACLETGNLDYLIIPQTAYFPQIIIYIYNLIKTIFVLAHKNMIHNQISN